MDRMAKKATADAWTISRSPSTCATTRRRTRRQSPADRWCGEPAELAAARSCRVRAMAHPTAAGDRPQRTRSFRSSAAGGGSVLVLLPDGLTPSVLAFVLVAALAAGWVDAVVGGGGLIQLPALLLVPGLAPVQALGTNKLASVFG